MFSNRIMRLPSIFLYKFSSSNYPTIERVDVIIVTATWSYLDLKEETKKLQKTKAPTLILCISTFESSFLIASYNIVVPLLTFAATFVFS